jgi:hypothetical protein
MRNVAPGIETMDDRSGVATDLALIARSSPDRG